MKDRMASGPARVENELPTPGRRVSRTLRWLGIILPLVMTWLALVFVFGRGSLIGFQTALALSAALWVGLAIALGWRRDWKGALAISVFYVIADAYWWLLALRVIHFD